MQAAWSEVDDGETFLPDHLDAVVAAETPDSLRDSWRVGTTDGSAGAEIAIVPWCWRGGEVLTALVDAAVDPALVIRMGEGSLYHEQDGLEGQSDVRWLATIVGARATWKSEESVSIVIDTDGLFVLHGSVPPRRLGAPPAGGAGRRSRRPGAHRPPEPVDPATRITHVELKRRPWTRAGMMSWTLTVETVDGAQARVFLTTDHQVATARAHLARVLGARFVV